MSPGLLACAPAKGFGASLLSAFVILAFAATPALANSAHGYEREIGLGPGEGAGQLEMVAPFREIYGNAPWKRATDSIAGSGVAVEDTNHDVYVADTGNSRVDEFGSKGEFVRAFGAKVEPMTDGDVCTSLCQKGAVGRHAGRIVR